MAVSQNLKGSFIKDVFGFFILERVKEEKLKLLEKESTFHFEKV